MRPHRLELTGQVFGNWLVLEKGDLGGGGEIYWKCRCICGLERMVRASGLAGGRSTNCGCQRGEHRMTKSKTYKSWDSMRQRCNNPNAPDYKRYGGRGIQVCERWNESFQNFLADMGVRPDGLTLDRRDNSKNYEPDNCRWATPTEQQQNKRNCPTVEYEGAMVSIASLATSRGLPIKVLKWRLDHNWDLHMALAAPVRAKRS